MWLVISFLPQRNKINYKSNWKKRNKVEGRKSKKYHVVLYEKTTTSSRKTDGVNNSLKRLSKVCELIKLIEYD